MSALKQIEEHKDLLSTSAGVAFTPPSLIADLAEKEKMAPNRQLNGDEKAGLSSILGWDGKDGRGKGMTGTLGFVRQQEFSLLYSQHVPAILPPPPVAESSSSSETSTSPLEPPKPKFSACDRPRWITTTFHESICRFMVVQMAHAC
jgi:1-phosphatidylinositol-3-phosphate 5-kinase